MAEINRIIKNARDVLVGKVPDPQSQIDQITLALIYKFMDAKDQDAVALGLKKTFFVGKFEEYSFTKIMQATSNEKQYELYQKGIDDLRLRQDLPSTFISVFKDAFIPYRDALTLHLFLVEINKIPTDNTELLGTAFEDLLSIMGSQGDAGQFRTPRHIIDMIVEIVAPKKGERILDPACGTAGFLISAYNKVTQQELTVAEKDDLINNGLVGYDINPNMVKLSNVNLFLHGCQKPNIHLYDTLTEKDFWSDKYDVILANPPFMTPKGGIRPHELFSAINANRSEVLFTYYITQHLKRNGRAGFIVPEGVVFQTANAYKEMRRILVDEGYLYAVISLPSGVFNPYSGVKTSILLLDKALAQKTDKILFVKMTNDGFDLGAQRRPIDKNDIPQVIETVRSFAFSIETETENEFVDKAGLSIVATKEQIRKNDCVLVGDRYREGIKIASSYPIVRLGDICEIERGASPRPIKKYITKGDGVNWIKIGDGNESSCYISSTQEKITFEGAKRSRFVKKGDLILSNSMSFGKPYILQIDGCVHDGWLIIHNDQKIVNSKYLCYLLGSDIMMKEYKRVATGGVVNNLNSNLVKNCLIPLPSIERQEEIVAEIEILEKEIKNKEQEIIEKKNTIAVKLSRIWNA